MHSKYCNGLNSLSFSTALDFCFDNSLMGVLIFFVIQKKKQIVIDFIFEYIIIKITTNMHHTKGFDVIKGKIYKQIQRIMSGSVTQLWKPTSRHAPPPFLGLHDGGAFRSFSNPTMWKNSKNFAWPWVSIGSWWWYLKVQWTWVSNWTLLFAMVFLIQQQGSGRTVCIKLINKSTF